MHHIGSSTMLWSWFQGSWTQPHKVLNLISGFLYTIAEGLEIDFRALGNNFTRSWIWSQVSWTQLHSKVWVEMWLCSHCCCAGTHVMNSSGTSRLSKVPRDTLPTSPQWTLSHMTNLVRLMCAVWWAVCRHLGSRKSASVLVIGSILQKHGTHIC